MRDRSRLTRTVVVPLRSSGTNGAGVQLTYLKSLEEAGLFALLVDDAELGLEMLGKVGGLLLPGGADVDPRTYSGDRHPTTRVEPGLDDLELTLVQGAFDFELPTLAICRGHQVLNVALGGSLVQDIATLRPGSLVHTPTVIEQGGFKDASHDVVIEPASQLSRMLGERANVNSAHHQAIDKLGKGLLPIAWSEDGTIEAVEREGAGFFLGVQFHPERWTDEVRRPIFSGFADAIAKRQAVTAKVPIERLTEVGAHRSGREQLD